MSALTDRLRARRVWPSRGRLLIGAAGLLGVAIVVCLIAGVSPLLPLFIAFLLVTCVRPVIGLGYALVVPCTSLGLWAVGVQGLVAFGGRSYVLSVSAAAVVFVLALRCRPTRPLWLPLAALAAIVLLGTVVGV